MVRIESEYIKTGFFWLPETPEKKIPGILTINDGGNIELEVVGLFEEKLHGFNDGDMDLGRIIGHVEKDGLVTLDTCFYTNKNHSFGGISKSKVCVNRVLSGVSYEKDEDVTFNTMSFSIECLDEWVDISGIDVKSNFEEKSSKITYTAPKIISCKLENGMELEIGFSYTLPGFPNIVEAKITQNVFFKLKSEELRPFEDFTGVIYKLTNFLCLAVDDTVSIRRLYATSSEIQREHDGGKKTYPAPIYIYYSSLPFSEKIPKRNWHQMLFTFALIKDNMEVFFNNWINAYETLSPTLGLYFSTRMGVHKYLDSKFLALAQGLETYHRRTSNETLMDENIFEELVSGLIETCPVDNKDWLKGRLKYGNEINLGKRIKKIIEPFKEHIGSSSERSKLLRKIVNTRNYLTHYSQELKDKAADGRELWILCQKMEAILQLHFLNIIGFNNSEITEVLEKCYPLKRKLNEI